MKKAPKARTTRRTSTTQELAVPMPPLVAAIAVFCDPGYQGVNPDFRRAWDAVPRIVAEMAEKHEGAEPREQFVSNEANAAIEHSRKGPDRYDRHLAEGVRLLDAANEDYLYAVHNAWSEPAFNVGLALGVYLSLNGGTR